MPADTLYFTVTAPSTVVNVDSLTSNPINGSQDLYLMDGGDISDLEIKKMGKGDGAADTFNFDLSAFDDDFTVNIVSEGSEDSFIIDNASSFSVNSSGVYTILYIGSDGNSHEVTIDPENASVIVNLAGDDIVSGTSGDDVIDQFYLGDPHGDVVDGADGIDDVIDALGGNDRISAGDGQDTVYGGSGADTIYGQGGNDLIYGGVGDDLIYGGVGDDTIFSGAGNDTIYGGADADALDGGSGDDALGGGEGNDTLSGQLGDDLLTGGGGDDVFIYAPGDGNDTITDFNFGNTGALGDGDITNNDFIDLGAYYDSMDELRADFADDGILNQSNALDDEGNATDYSDNTQFSGGSVTMQGATPASFTADNTGVVCFTSGTAIMTPTGEVLIDELRPGDMVNTLDNGPQPIAWIGRRDVTKMELAAQETLRPIMIKKSVLGAKRDIFVSRQHGMLINGDNFARAIHLADYLPGVRIAHGKKKVTYIHLMFDAHQIIFAEGMPSESFFPGPQALAMMASHEFKKLVSSFPQLENIDTLEAAPECYGALARPFLKHKEVEKACRKLTNTVSPKAKNKCATPLIDKAVFRQKPKAL
jgi:hypothetical protein